MNPNWRGYLQTSLGLPNQSDKIISVCMWIFHVGIFEIVNLGVWSVCRRLFERSWRFSNFTWHKWTINLILNPACITQAKFIFTWRKGPCQRILECHSSFQAKTLKIHWMFQSTQLQIPTPGWSSKHRGSRISSGELCPGLLICTYFDMMEDNGRKKIN